MKTMHMNPEEAVQAHLDLHAKQSLGMHYGTWQLTDEGIDAPVEALHAAREEADVSPENFQAATFGGTTRM